MTRMFSRAGKIPGPTSLPNTKDRLERLVRQLRRGGFLPGDAQPLTEMANVVDERLIRAIMTDQSRVLTQLLLNPSTLVIICTSKHMAMSSLRRTNIILYLVCCIKHLLQKMKSSVGHSSVGLTI